MAHGGEGAGFVQILDGQTFMLSDERGDVDGSPMTGLFHDDTRYLSRFELSFGGHSLTLLRSRKSNASAVVFHLTNPKGQSLDAQSLSVRRRRVVADGLREQIRVWNHLPRPVRVELRLVCNADFASVFEVRGEGFGAEGRLEIDADPGRGLVRFAYDDGPFSAATLLESPDATGIERHGSGDHSARELVFDVELEAHGEWETTVDVRFEPDGDSSALPDVADLHAAEAEERRIRERFADELPDVRAGWKTIERVYRRSAADLASLRLRSKIGGHEIYLPAGGMPWFMAVLGRDALIVGYETLPFAPELARGALCTLAALQSHTYDDRTDAEPGKIAHELRRGRLVVTGRKPFGPYYGTTDATQLFLVLLSEYWRFTGDDALCHELRDNAMAAVRWMDTFGDADGDGFIEYRRRSTEGPRNQCWKDSDDSIRFADGRFAEPPIAVCEAQGYAYDARVRMAEIAARVWNDDELAGRLRRDAEQLYDRFNDVFWISSRDHYALALDKDKNCVDALTSNVGHLLWSGIVPPDRAERLARHLLSTEMFSGWGVRTMSAADGGYSPISYHTGSVWPHDNAIIVAGLARYGFHDEAGTIARGMLEAAERFDRDQLPELFAGYARDDTTVPVWYPEASSPQAFAAAAPLLLLRSVLGIEPAGESIAVDPHVPEAMGDIEVRGLHGFGRRFDVTSGGMTKERR